MVERGLERVGRGWERVGRGWEVVERGLEKILDCGFWILVGPPEATAKPKGGRRKIAAPIPTVHRAVYSVPPAWAEAGSD